MTTGLLWDERFAWFHAGEIVKPFYQPIGRYDTPRSKERIRELLVVSGLAQQLRPLASRCASDEALLRYHTPDYLHRVKQLSANEGGIVGPDAYLGPNGYEIARLAVGGCLEAITAVLDGTVNNAYALVRPCGHHALPDAGMGNCIFNNVTVAVMEVQARRRVGKIAIIDWDVHHGNGTQLAFYDDPSVLTISIHQDNTYPLDSGLLAENGSGAGTGCNINIPLPPGSGHGAYTATIEQVVIPALHRFQPELIVIASGLDANAADPLGRMLCYSDTFREMTARLLTAADELCKGRLVACHEGGYSESYAPFCGLAIVEALAEITTQIIDHRGHYFAQLAGQTVQKSQMALIEQAAKLVQNIPNL